MPDEPTSEAPEHSADPGREPSVVELMGGPGRPSDGLKKSILWLCAAIVLGMIALTFWVSLWRGFDFLSVLSLMILGVILVALFGAIRYKGEDPLAHLEPPKEPDSKLFWRRDHTDK